MTWKARWYGQDVFYCWQFVLRGFVDWVAFSDLFCLYCPAINLHNSSEFLSKNSLALYNKPMFSATLFSIYLIWSFEDRFSSSRTPRNFIDFTLCISRFLISKLGNKRGRPCFLFGLCKREYFVFPTFICFKPFINFLQFLIN